MSTLLTSGELNLPDEILNPWLTKVRYGSSVATLCPAAPMKFGKGHAMSWDIGEAEYVGEGANKGTSNMLKVSMTADPYKFHKTVRWTEEVKWANEDAQIDTLKQILDQIQPALSRALDFGIYHGTNPSTGEAVPAMATYLEQTPNQVALGTSAPYAAIDAADALVLAAGYAPSDIAVDPTFASQFAFLRNEQTHQKMYPDLTLATSPAGNLEGHRSSVSDTVGSKGRIVNEAGTGYEAVPGDTLAIDGDFRGVRWGIQRAIALKMIEYGDPDGQGDLQRNNQVAFRAEVLYGWGIADLAAFTEIHA